MGNIPVNVVVDGSQAVDNLAEIDKHFHKQHDLTGKKYAEGWAYHCKHCGSYAYSVEVWFECQNIFLPVKILCSNWSCLRKTNAIWKLEITVFASGKH